MMTLDSSQASSVVTATQAVTVTWEKPPSPAAVDGEERKTPTRILEEPAQPSFLPSVNSYRLFLLNIFRV